MYEQIIKWINNWKVEMLTYSLFFFYKHKWDFLDPICIYFSSCSLNLHFQIYLLFSFFPPVDIYKSSSSLWFDDSRLYLLCWGAFSVFFLWKSDKLERPARTFYTDRWSIFTSESFEKARRTCCFSWLCGCRWGEADRPVVLHWFC